MEFPSRVNISYLLQGKPLEYAREANAEIFVRGGEFEFSPRGQAIPHVTMLMGEVKSLQDLEELFDVVAKASFEFENIDFELSAPYFRDARRKFVFVDTNPQESFLKQRRLLQEWVGPLLKIDHYGNAENVSHITLGYNDLGNDATLLAHISSSAPIAGKASQLQVARTGARGTCIETLRTFARSR